MLGRYRESARAWTDPIGRLLFRLRLRPNHLTLAGFGVSLVTTAAFVAGRTRLAGVLLLFAGLFDFFDGSLARASGQVTPFGAFLDSVIDRYSDLVVLLGIVVLFAGMPHARGALVAMAGLVGSVMVSYTKARAESIGIECNVGMMERPERLICLIAGALLDMLEPALWILAIMANLTAIQRIMFTRRAMRDTALLCVAGALLAVAAGPALAAGATAPTPEMERTWARAVEAYQSGDPRPVVREFSQSAALASPIGDYVRLLLADAQARLGDLGAAQASALAVAEKYPDGRLTPGALILAATLASRAGDEAAAQAALKRLLAAHDDAAEAPQALYMLGLVGEARGQLDAAAAAYRELQVRVPASAWADGADDRLAALAAEGVHVPELSLTQRMSRAERLLKGGVPKTASDEAERIAREARDPGLVVRALRVVADASQRLGRYDVAARALELAASRAPADRKPGIVLEQARLLLRAGKRERALGALAKVEATGAAAEASEAALLKARTLDEMDRTVQAAAAYRTVVTRYAHREVAAAALWRLGWLEYLKGNVRGAEREWRRLGELPGGRIYRLPALYWRARAVEQTAGREAGEKLYRALLTEAPRSYYGVLAARRVAAPAAPSEEPSIRLPADPREALADDPGFVRVELLRRVGLVEFAVQELEDVMARSVGDPVRLYALSGEYVRDERYHLALRILRRHFESLAWSGSQALPRAFWEMLYPLPWREEIADAAERAGLDPYFVAAIVREESSYSPRAVSRSGARGLMQLMPATAQPMAEHRGLPFRQGDLLDDPRANLQIGASFLADLVKEWSDPWLAIAAYNAGPRRVREWWQARRTNDVEAFIEQIPFTETRLYVKQVVLAWDEYRRIYSSSPR